MWVITGIAGIPYGLLYLAFLPARCGVAKFRLKQEVADHGLEPYFDIPALAAPARPTTFALDMCQYSLQNIASAGLRNM